MMHWNVTYNDPNRWNEVYAICGPKWPWLDGVRQSLKGNPLGSPKMDLIGLEGLEELQTMRDVLNHRTGVNFLRTTDGVIAFTKVRLEVYAIPIRCSEVLEVVDGPSHDSLGKAEVRITFSRGGQQVTMRMEGSQSATNRMTQWLKKGVAAVS
jgi:hypothetical protein